MDASFKICINVIRNFSIVQVSKIQILALMSIVYLPLI